MAPVILSPFTITLGDEFQGIVRTLRSSVETIFCFEEEILSRGYAFQLHYVAHRGEIKTPINPSIAYEMMGPGLTTARSILTEKKRTRPRFVFEYGKGSTSIVLNDLFFVLERIIDHWRVRDYDLIMDMIGNTSNIEVARMQKRDRTAVWRRRESLRVEEYRRQKEAIVHVANLVDADLSAETGQSAGRQPKK
jgi:hypothetical protein